MFFTHVFHSFLQYIVVGNPDKYIARFFTHMVSITIEVFKHLISTFPRPLFEQHSQHVFKRPLDAQLFSDGEIYVETEVI